MAPAQEFLFRGIQKGEWTNLFQFISVKGLPVANLAEAERGPGGATRTLDLDLGDDIDDGGVVPRGVVSAQSPRQELWKPPLFVFLNCGGKAEDDATLTLDPDLGEDADECMALSVSSAQNFLSRDSGPLLDAECDAASKFNLVTLTRMPHHTTRLPKRVSRSHHRGGVRSLTAPQYLVEDLPYPPSPICRHGAHGR